LCDMEGQRRRDVLHAHQRVDNQIEEDIRDSEEGSKEIRVDSPSLDSRHQERQITQHKIMERLKRIQRKFLLSIFAIVVELRARLSSTAKEMRLNTKERIQLKGIVGGKVVTKGTATLVLEIGQDQELEQTFHAVENLDFDDTDGILGIDFMEKHRIEFAYQRDGNVMKTRKYEVKLAKNEYAEKGILNMKKNKIDLPNVKVKINIRWNKILIFTVSF
jgi:hypothetical protein